MQRLGELFIKAGFAFFVFFLSIIFFNWPFLSMIKRDRLENMFFYLFIVWCIVIILLYLMGRSYQKTIRKRKRSGGEE